MKMSDVFPLPIEIDNYKGVALSPDRNKAIEHAVNHHDALVDMLQALTETEYNGQLLDEAEQLLDEVTAND